MGLTAGAGATRGGEVKGTRLGFRCSWRRLRSSMELCGVLTPRRTAYTDSR